MHRESRGSSAETDYLVEIEGQILPVEVNSGRSGRLRSLHLLLDTFPGNSLRLVTVQGTCTYDAQLPADCWT